jgi:hypothetical protein
MRWLRSLTEERSLYDSDEVLPMVKLREDGSVARGRDKPDEASLAPLVLRPKNRFQQLF